MTKQAHKKKRCRGDSPAKRQQILDGARDIFIKNGYYRASMSAIARQSGVSKGTLYNYFSDKADLFSTFIRLECEDKVHFMLAPLSQEHHTPHEVLFSIAQIFLQLISEPNALLLCRIILSEAQNFPHIGQVFWDNGPQVAITRLTHWIDKQNKKGKLHVDDPEFAAEQFLTLCQTRIIQRLRLNIPIPEKFCHKKQVIEQAVKVFLAAYSCKET